MSITFLFLYKNVDETPALKATDSSSVPEDISRMFDRRSELESLKAPNPDEVDELFEICNKTGVWFYGDIYKKIPPAMDAMKTVKFGESLRTNGSVVMFNMTLDE